MISTQSLRRGIQGGLAVLVAVMPFHAFLSVWVGTSIGHEALVQSWKELLLMALTIMVAILLLRDAQHRDRLKTWPVYLIAALALVSLIVTVISHPSLTAIAFGAKTDFEYLLAFTVASVATSRHLVKNLTWTILVPACIVVAFGLLEVYVLPASFLSHFGYGSATIRPYETLGSAVSSLRFPSTLGGPNQLGTYLILPFALSLVLAVRRKLWPWLALVGADVVVLIHTYSRAAWLGEAATAVTLVLILMPHRHRLRVAAILAAVALIMAAAIEWLIKKGSPLQYYIFHNSKLSHSPLNSDTLHFQSLQTGLRDTLEKPWGHGLGTAGPALFHTGSGLIIENNYLQLSYETGIVGAALFIALVAAVGYELTRQAAHIDLAAAALAALVGMSVTALFLPAWTDSSTALIFWIAAGSVTGLTPDTRHV